MVSHTYRKKSRLIRSFTLNQSLNSLNSLASVPSSLTEATTHTAEMIAQIADRMRSMMRKIDLGLKTLIQHSMGKTTCFYFGRKSKKTKKVSFSSSSSSVDHFFLKKKTTHRRGPEAQCPGEPKDRAHEGQHHRQKGAQDHVDRPEDDPELSLTQAQGPLAVALLLDAVLDGELDALKQGLRPD